MKIAKMQYIIQVTVLFLVQWMAVLVTPLVSKWTAKNASFKFITVCVAGQNEIQVKMILT